MEDIIMKSILISLGFLLAATGAVGMQKLPQSVKDCSFAYAKYKPMAATCMTFVPSVGVYNTRDGQQSCVAEQYQAFLKECLQEANKNNPTK